MERRNHLCETRAIKPHRPMQWEDRTSPYQVPPSLCLQVRLNIRVTFSKLEDIGNIRPSMIPDPLSRLCPRLIRFQNLVRLRFPNRFDRNPSPPQRTPKAMKPIANFPHHGTPARGKAKGMDGPAIPASSLHRIRIMLAATAWVQIQGTCTNTMPCLLSRTHTDTPTTRLTQRSVDPRQTCTGRTTLHRPWRNRPHREVWA